MTEYDASDLESPNSSATLSTVYGVMVHHEPTPRRYIGRTLNWMARHLQTLGYWLETIAWKHSSQWLPASQTTTGDADDTITVRWDANGLLVVDTEDEPA